MAVQPMQKFAQFADIKDASMQGKSKGESYTWNVYSDIATRGNTLTETNTITESNFTITQGTLTITEGGNAVPYTGKLDALSEQPITEIINKVLKNDAGKYLDALPYNQFDATPLRVVATGGTSTNAVTLTTDGTATATNNVAFGKDHVKAIVDVMKERNIPAYTSDDYYAIAWPTTFRTMKNDLETINQYTTEGLKNIRNGEIGRYEGVRFVEQTNIPKGGAADSTTFDALTNTADAWDNAASDWVFFFGDDTVAEAVAVPLEMRGKIPTDYGRSKGVAWYYLGGFGLVHTQALEARVVKWDSAV